MKTITYMSSLLTFYLKGEISQDQNFLALKIPNTILTFIPLGARKDNIPVPQLSSVSTNFHLDFKSFIVGIIVAIIGFATIKSSFLTFLILLLLGASMVISSFHTILSIKTTSGEAKNISFLIFEKAKAEEAANMINASIANRQDDTNVRQQNEILGDRLVDAIGSLNKNQ